MENNRENCVNRPDKKCISQRNASGSEASNSENSCMKEKELDWSRDKRRGFVERSHGG